MYNISNTSHKYQIYQIYPMYWRVTIKNICFGEIRSNCYWSLLFTTTPRGVGVFLNCFQPLQQAQDQDQDAMSGPVPEMRTSQLVSECGLRAIQPIGLTWSYSDKGPSLRCQQLLADSSNQDVNLRIYTWTHWVTDRQLLRNIVSVALAHAKTIHKPYGKNTQIY